MHPGWIHAVDRGGGRVDAAQYLLAVDAFRRACEELRWLSLVRGAYRRTARRMARAVAVALAAGLLGVTPLARPAAGAACLPEYGFEGRTPLGHVGRVASPAFADIDSDGDLDVFVGQDYGSTVFFENTGSASSPAFASPSINPFGLADVGCVASPAFADIDYDGDLDAFVGELYGSTVFFENTGSASSPAFASPSTNPFGLPDVGYAASPALADIDGDGDLDAFVGEEDGKTLFFENTALCVAACAPAPVSGCTTPGKALFKLQANPDPAKRRFLWKWLRGTAGKTDFGDPATGTTSFALCVCDDGDLEMSPVVEAGGICEGKRCWAETKPGFKYTNKAGNDEGVFKVLLKEGAGKAKILMKGKGSNVTLPALPLDQATEVKVQLVKDAASGPGCWESSFTPDAIRNDYGQFKDKVP